jgi:DNA repair exonuclease SbcCD nuclease subunit
MSRILITADLHAKDHQYARRPEIRGDAEYAMAQILEHVKDGVGAVVVAGDTFDSARPSAKNVKALLQFSKAVYAATAEPIRYLEGNHDMDDWLGVEGNTYCEHIGTGEVVSICGLQVIGYNYMSGRGFRAALPNIPPWVNVIFAHQRFKEAYPFGHQCSMVDVPPYVKYVISGDRHEGCEVRAADGAMLIYPGAPYPTSSGDLSHEKHVLILDVEEGEVKKMSYLPLLVRPTVSLKTAITQDNVDLVRERVEAAYAEAVNVIPEEHASVRIPRLVAQYDPLNIAYATIMDSLPKEHCHAFVQSVAHTADEEAADSSKYTGSTNLDMSQFVGDVVDPTEDPSVHAAVLSLVTGSSVEKACRSLALASGVSEESADQVVPTIKSTEVRV